MIVFNDVTNTAEIRSLGLYEYTKDMLEAFSKGYTVYNDLSGTAPMILGNMCLATFYKAVETKAETKAEAKQDTPQKSDTPKAKKLSQQ